MHFNKFHGNVVKRNKHEKLNRISTCAIFSSRRSCHRCSDVVVKHSRLVA